MKKTIILIYILFIAGFSFFGYWQWQRLKQENSQLNKDKKKIESILGMPIDEAFRFKKQSEMTINIFFKIGVPEEVIFRLQDNITRSNLAESTKYVSDTEAKKIFKELNPDLSDIILSVPLPASLDLESKRIPELIDYLEKVKDEYEIEMVINNGREVVKGSKSTDESNLTNPSFKKFNQPKYSFDYPFDLTIYYPSSIIDEIDVLFSEKQQNNVFWLREISIVDIKKHYQDSSDISTSEAMLGFQAPQATKLKKSTSVKINQLEFTKNIYDVCQLPECVEIIEQDYGYGIKINGRYLLFYNFDLDEKDFEEMILGSLIVK